MLRIKIPFVVSKNDISNLILSEWDTIKATDQSDLTLNDNDLLE